MRKNRFNILALEEFDDSQVDGEVEQSSTPVADAIESENSAVELNNEVTTFEDHCEQQNEAIDTVTELQEQVDEQEEVLENNPEEVTDQTVEVAQEQFYITMNKITNLGYYGSAGTISHELSAGTSIERLKVSCEGIKDFISKVIDKIISFFKAIKDWFVKILQKIGLLKDNNKKIEETLNNLPDSKQVNKEKLEEEIEKEPESYNETFGFYGLNLDYFKTFLNGTFFANYSKLLKKIQESFKKYDELIADLRGKGTNVNEDYIVNIKNTLLRALPETPQSDYKDIYDSFGGNVINTLSRFEKSCIIEIKRNKTTVVGILKNAHKDDNKIKFTIEKSVVESSMVVANKKIKNMIIQYVLDNKKIINDAFKNKANKAFDDAKKEGDKLSENLAKLNKDFEDYKNYIEKQDNSNGKYHAKNCFPLMLEFNKYINYAIVGYVNTITDYYKTYSRIISYVDKVSKKANITKKDNSKADKNK